ncbi:MAG: hypothetical protein U0Y68_03235 [Blastocatellia bacterium]
MIPKDINLTRFFAWARERALAELNARLAADPQLDPNWTFSDIMQELLREYQQAHATPDAAPSEPTSNTN